LIICDKFAATYKTYAIKVTEGTSYGTGGSDKSAK
jgi:hypothetical protein